MGTSAGCLALAAGAGWLARRTGAAFDLPHRLFANLGLAAQSGSQQVDSGLDFTTTFLRITGVGMKL